MRNTETILRDVQVLSEGRPELVSRETSVRLQAYADLLTRWQNRINLIGQSTADDIWARHFCDSAQVLRHVPDARIWLDMGSGAGFPGLVIATLLADDAQGKTILVEANGKKSAFLREVTRTLGLNALVLTRRLEALNFEDVGPVDGVTARALASLPTLLTLGAPWLSNGAVGAFLKGRSIDDEVADAHRDWKFSANHEKSLCDPTGTVLIVTELKRRDGATDDGK